MPLKITIMKRIGTSYCNKLYLLSVAHHVLCTRCAADTGVSAHLKITEALLTLLDQCYYESRSLVGMFSSFSFPCDLNWKQIHLYFLPFLGKEGWERGFIVTCQQASAGRSRLLLLALWQSTLSYHTKAWFLAQKGCLKECLAGLANTRTFYSNASKMLLV